MSECRQCVEGSIQSNGICDLCGFDEMIFINEHDDWADDTTLADWVEYQEAA